jgi:hypothetical protein
MHHHSEKRGDTERWWQPACSAMFTKLCLTELNHKNPGAMTKCIKPPLFCWMIKINIARDPTMLISKKEKKTQY